MEEEEEEEDGDGERMGLHGSIMASHPLRLGTKSKRKQREKTGGKKWRSTWQPARNIKKRHLEIMEFNWVQFFFQW